MIDAGGEAPPGYWRRRLGLRATLVALVAIGVAATVARNGRRAARPLEVYGHVPAFQLVDQTGAPFTDTAMLGHVNVVDFIFTRCASSCPRLTARMAALQARLASERSSAHLVSFSVDPENDTPRVLADYASQAGADSARWSFLTGSVDNVKAAVVRGFKVAFDKVPQSDGARNYDVTHGDWFVLVDARGALRGYYTTEEPRDVDRLVADVLRLERSGLERSER